jgi:sugar lactone lactonase YvrE
VGVFVLGAMLACDRGDEGEVVESGYVYVGEMGAEREHVYKVKADSGEKVYGLGGQAGYELSMAVDSRNNDVFIYYVNILSRYSYNGRLYYEKDIEGGFMGDHMVYDEKGGNVWIYTCNDGNLERYRAEDGVFAFRFHTGFSTIDQLVYDCEEGVLWVVNSGGHNIKKFSAEGKELLEIKEPSWLTPMAIDYLDDTIVFGYYDRGKGKATVRRYNRKGQKVGEFPTTLRSGLSARCIAVQPGTRNIWISEGAKTEIYTPEGNLLKVIETSGFVDMEFNDRRTAFFGLDTKGKAHAIRLADYETLWTAETIFSPEESGAIIYTPK